MSESGSWPDRQLSGQKLGKPTFETDAPAKEVPANIGDTPDLNLQISTCQTSMRGAKC